MRIERRVGVVALVPCLVAAGANPALGQTTEEEVSPPPPAEAAPVRQGATAGSDLDSKSLFELQFGVSAERWKQLDADRDAKKEDTPLGVVLRLREAIKPGVRLIGDAYSELTDGNGSPETQGAVGAGVEIETPWSRWLFVIKKGTKPSTLTTATDFGRSMLEPQTQDFSLSIDGTWAPWRPKLGVLLGFGGFLRTAKTEWEVELAPQQDGATPDQDIPRTAASAVAVTAAVSVGGRARYILSQQDNLIDVSAYLGPSLYAVSVERNANDLVRAARERDPRVDERGFKQHAIGTRESAFAGGDFALSMRVNQVEISARLIVVSGDVPGLSGLRFIPSFSLRSGVTLIDL